MEFPPQEGPQGGHRDAQAAGLRDSKEDISIFRCEDEPPEPRELPG